LTLRESLFRILEYNQAGNYTKKELDTARAQEKALICQMSINTMKAKSLLKEISLMVRKRKVLIS
jgi:hypothetical protein